MNALITNHTLIVTQMVIQTVIELLENIGCWEGQLIL